MTGRS
jgi:hypothetical protein